MKRRNFLKVAAATAGIPAVGFSAEQGRKWEITRIPLPGPECVAIAAEKDALWALYSREIFFKTADSEEWQNYTDYLLGPAWCFCVVPDEEKLPKDRMVYAGIQSRVVPSPAISWQKTGDREGVSGGLWMDKLKPSSRLTSLLAMPDENGTPTLFAADAAQRNVLRYDADGKFMHRLYADGELIVPSPYLAMCVGRDGLLRVVNPGRHRVEAFHVKAAGTPREEPLTWGVSSPGPEGFAGCCNPAWIAVTESGNFFTSEKRILRLKLHDAEGNFIEEVPLPPQQKNVITEGYPVAAEGENLYVLDTNANVVYRYAKK